jgi:hypothetical protein
MPSNLAEPVGPRLSNTHARIRALAIVGIVVLLLHRVLQRNLPDLLPTAGWRPTSLLHKWFGIAIDALGLFVLLGTLFASLILMYVVFVNSKVRKDQTDCWIDLCFVVALYVTLALS